MQFSFLGYSVKKIMELNLDVKDVAILRFFDDFRQSGRMNYEVIEGVTYYWISYQSIENELPFLGLGKRSIMMRMLKLRDLGVLSHYTKKEGGTFSFYTLGERYKELLYISKDMTNDNNDKFNGGSGQDSDNKCDKVSRETIDNKFSSISEQANYLKEANIISTGGQATYYEENIINEREISTEKQNSEVINNEEGITKDVEGNNNFKFFEEDKHNKEVGVYLNNNKGYAKECSTKTNLLNNSSTIVTNIYNNIKDKVSSIIEYLNSKIGVMYKSSNTKTINLVKARLTEGFTIQDFKTVIDKKVKAWKGTIFEQYLTPFTLFGDKFEVYLNQNIVKQEESKNNNPYGNKVSHSRNKKLKFDNFKGRDYDYDELEKKLLGWD